MDFRRLGVTGVKVSEIGMGCNRLGEKGMPDAHWVDLVHHAISQGVTLFDTAEAYGWSRSEEILGLAIGNRDDVLVADKVCRVRETGVRDWSSARILQRLDESLRKLRRDRIDIYQLHSPRLNEMQFYDWPVAMTRAKEAGKIRFVGVSINDVPSGMYLIENHLADVMQVPFNILEPSVGQGIFGAAADAGIGIMVRVPMAQGILTGKFSPLAEVPEGHRALLAGDSLSEHIRRAEGVRPIAAFANVPMNLLALRYVLSQRGVTAAIPGARNKEQLDLNVVASNGSGLPENVLAEIAALQRTWA